MHKNWCGIHLPICERLENINSVKNGNNMKTQKIISLSYPLLEIMCILLFFVPTGIKYSLM